MKIVSLVPLGLIAVVAASCGSTDTAPTARDAAPFARQFAVDLFQANASAVNREIAPEARLPQEFIDDSLRFWRTQGFAVRIKNVQPSGKSSFRVSFVATRTPMRGYVERQRGVVVVHVGTSHGRPAVFMFNTRTDHIELTPRQ